MENRNEQEEKRDIKGNTKKTHALTLDNKEWISREVLEIRERETYFFEFFSDFLFAFLLLFFK